MRQSFAQAEGGGTFTEESSRRTYRTNDTTIFEKIGPPVLLIHQIVVNSKSLLDEPTEMTLISNGSKQINDCI